MMMDVTGDGLDDLVVPTVPWEAGSHIEIPTTDWTVTPNLGPPPKKKKGFLQAPTLAYSEDHNDAANDPVLQQQPDLQVQPDYGTPIDYDHDGRMDLLVHNVHGTAFDFSPNWQVLLATSKHTFLPKDTGIPRPKHLLDGGPSLENHEASAHLADVNGDGIADLLQCERDPSFGGGDAFSWTLRLWAPAGPGFETTPRAISALTLFHCAWELQPVDLDADGKVDLVLPEISQNQVLPREDRFSLSYDEASDTWEKEAIGTLSGAMGPRYFLDVNSDGLPDVVQLDVMTGRPATIINTGDRHGARFGAPIAAVIDTIAPDFSPLWSLAAVLDINGDGRQDLLVPGLEGDGGAGWNVLESKGNGTFIVNGSGLPLEAELTQQGTTIANRLGPRITDIDGDGSPDVLLPIGQTFTLFRSNHTHRDLLFSIHDGLNAHDPLDTDNVANLTITYGTLIDTAMTKGAPVAKGTDQGEDYLSRGWFAPDCAYPLRCVVGPRPVVTGYTRNNGADGLRSSRVQYRGGRYDRLGRGFLGFEAMITTDLDTLGGTLDLYGDTLPAKAGEATIFPAAGQLQRQVRWTPNPQPDDPGRVELSFTSIARELRPTSGGATYFQMPVAVARSRRQGSFKPGGAQSLLAWLQLSAEADSINVEGATVTTTAFDDFGNVLASLTAAPEVDLTSSLSEVKVTNDVAAWLLGQVTHRKECSSAAGVTQCRTVTRSYNPATGLLAIETHDGDDASMHLALTFTRDAFGNVTTMTADDGIEPPRTVHTPYDPSGTFPASIENALGHVVTLGFDPGLGVMTSRVDENQLETRWDYDAFGRWTRELRPDGTKTTRTLTRTKNGGSKGDAWTVLLSSATDGGDESAVEYDSLARPIRWWTRGTQTGEAPAPRLMQEVAFDALGEHVAQRSTLLDEMAPAASRHHEEYTWDPAGRLLTHRAAWGATTRYDYEGKLAHVTDPFEQVTTLENDALGRLVKVSPPIDEATSYTYGPFGALTTITAPGNAVTTLVRDAFGRVRTSIDPDKGTTLLNYNGFGELRSSLDAQGRSTTLHRDLLGRVIGRDDQASGGPLEVTSWTWDSAPLGTSGALALGALASVVAPDGTAIVHSYDALARPSTIHRLIGGEPFDTALDYDDLGRVSIITYPEIAGLSPFTVRNEYDAHGHLLAVRNAAVEDKSAPPYWRLTGTDGADRTAVEAFGNGFTTTRKYDEARDRLTSLVTARAAQPPVQDLAYTYDDKLNLATRHDALQVANPTEHFGYDALDRLTCATFSDALKCPDADLYSYAPNGNLLTKPGIPGVYGYDPDHPHAVKSAGGESFTHDPTGNPTLRAGVSVTYTPFDMPRTFTPPAGQGKAVTLDYDGDQARVRKSTSDETTIYVGDLYERTTSTANGTVEQRFFVHGNERVVAVVTRSPGAGQTKTDQVRYLHVDHLGSVETVTGDSNKPLEKRSYDAFGERRNPAWGSAPGDLSTGTSRGFTGHEDDEDLRLVNMKGRLYDPHIGRFLTPDPFVSHPSFGQSWNPYSYVLNNPLAYTDPSGFRDDPVNSTCSGSCATFVYPTQGGTVTRIHVGGTAPAPRPAPPPPAPNVDQSLVGLGAAPTDLKATGNSAPGVPSPPVSGTPGGLAPRVHTNRQASPPAFDPTGGKSRTEIAGELVSGAASGVGQAAATALSVDLLRVPAGLLHVAGSAWASSDPVAGLGALFWEPGAAQVDDLVASAVDGDFKGAAEAGVKAITIGVATGVALGELGGAAVDAAKSVRADDAAKPGGSRRFSAEKRSAGLEKARDANGIPRCEYCGTDLSAKPGKANSYEADHRVPRSRGGPSNQENLAPACRTCNRSKGARTPEEWK
jgi:RHS repeat-associated protein